MNTKVRKLLNFLLQLIIILLAYWFIYRELFQKRDILQVVKILKDQFINRAFLYFLIYIFLLMFVNWGLEAQKWKYLIGKFEHISFFQSFKAVFSGVTVSVFTPNRIGEYFGRVFILKQLHPLKGVFITFIGSMGQLLSTIVFGLLALLFFMPRLFDISLFPNQLIYWSIVILSLLCIFFLILFYLNFQYVSTLIERLIPHKYEKIKRYTDIFKSYQSRELAFVFLFSILRYMIFSLQFILLLLAFHIKLPASQYLILVPLIFFAITVVPTIALSELGIRGSISLYLIGFFIENSGNLDNDTSVGIIAASTLLWVINLVLPAIIGALFVFNLRFLRPYKINSDK